MSQFWFFLVCFQTWCFGTGSLFAQEADNVPQPPRETGFSQTLVMIGLAILFFYLILWRPEQKRRKLMETQRSGLKKGDRVTAMGIIGTVSSIKENTVVLRMVDGAKIEFLKAAISEVLPAEEASTNSNGSTEE